MIQHGAAPGGALRAAPAVPEPMAAHAAEAVADMFKLLGDATRCRILYALLAAPDLPVSAIAADTGTSRTTVSAALRLLRMAGVVVARRDGREVHYRVADDHVAELLTVARQHSDHLDAARPMFAAATETLAAGGFSAPHPIAEEHAPAPAGATG